MAVVFRYKIESTVKKLKNGEYAAVDVISFDSGNSKTIIRKKGTEKECLAHAKKLAIYWRKKLTKK